MQSSRSFDALKAICCTAAVLGTGWVMGCLGPAVDSESESVGDEQGGPIAESDGNSEEAPRPPPAEICTTVVRGGPGNVTDAFLAGDYANYAAGADHNMYVGLSAGGNNNKMLFGFDISSVPASATLTSATFSAWKSWSTGNAQIEVHRATAPWNEATVTRESFGNASDGTAVGSFSGSGQGFKTVDITALVAAWRAGTYQNYGIVLEEQPIDRHHFYGSEAGASFAPSLKVCYIPASCADGVKNQGEAGIDCGGPCIPCATCSDAIQNQGETGLDCGGPCPSCATCSDGIKNGAETGIDCGGSCAACATCFDGVKNGAETDVDCGGSCQGCGAVLAGQFNINQGASWGANPPTYTCVEACASLFGGSSAQYGCSTVAGSLNHLAWVDGWGDSSHCPGGTPVADTYKKPTGASTYNCGAASCSFSALVSDHGCTGPNYCYKTIGAATSCKAIKNAIPGSVSGVYQVDTDGAGPKPTVSAYCDMTTDGGGYTMIRLNDAALATDQNAYANKCSAIGMEIIVPRTKPHAQAIQTWNGNEPPNVVNVFPNSNGATGLNNWHGTCQGATCSFYLSPNTNAWCNGFEPNGDNNVAYRIYRISNLCSIDTGYGGWNDANNTMAFTGSVICSTNDK